ncbi:MAG: fused MFS/spermidine synthase [Acidobacteriaceae bacterium]|jgi:spermidine synthase|nr:fused MFS/spermidine synthase [Acidobacteriaceae bacterium]
MNSRRLLPAMLLLFVGSGCAALIYEVVWFQLLELVIGSSAVSIAVLLGTFMGGMCLGSLLLPRFISTDAHPLRVYAWLELGIGSIGLLILFGMPVLGGVYTAWAGSGIVGILLRGVAAGICLLPPTLLMGATLPAIARWVERTPDGVAWLGFFYGGNTAGAVVGSLLAGFFLLSFYNVSVATYVAVALNIAVALLALFLAHLEPFASPVSDDAAAETRSAGVVTAETSDRRLVYLVIALSGLTALACEVLWTRQLSLLLGATVYTFSLILAVFLAGIGIGSSVGTLMGRHVAQPRIALGWCQLGLAACMAWAAWVLTQSLPYWPINPSISSSAWFEFQLDLVRCLYAVLPGAILWGASFPLALAAVSSKDEDPARLVGRVYAANTLGAIVGSLITGLVLIVWLGTQRSQQVLIIVAAISGLMVFAEAKFSALTLAAAGAAVGLLTLSVQPIPGVFVAYGRNTALQLGQSNIIYVGEGWNASVAVSEQSNGVRNYHNAGKVQASSEPQDMRLQRMLGHLTTLVPKTPSRVVVIGCGAGVTAGAVSIDPAVTHETIAEIEPLVPRVVSTYFSGPNFDVVRNPKVDVHLDDARHFLLTTHEKFDAITSDPLDPWVKGAAMLYTREFFELAKSRLNPGGIVTLFVQLYESNTEAVKSEIATFFEAFPKGMIFANTYNGAGYDLVLLGQVEGTTINLDEIEARLARPEYAPVKQSLADIGMPSVMDLFSTYAGSAEDMQPWLRDAQINQDRNLRLQYLAGRSLNVYQADVIFAQMLPYAGDPKGVFTGSQEKQDELLARIRSAQGR